jgi:glycosyltransferase involved in cell wall biosynthesis
VAAARAEAAARNGRPARDILKAVFVSYDGALDPLGASQVLPYVLGLAARGVAFTLLTFEKAERWSQVGARSALGRRLEAAGVGWRPLPYHRRARLPATAWDVMNGARELRSVLRDPTVSVVHCRGDVSAAMARLAGLRTETRLLYDMRGFFSDERVESGSWSRGGLLDRQVRRVERANLARADGIVVLTEVACELLRRQGGRLPPLRVIPTCADLSVFRPRSPAERPQFGVAYCGSLGTWYMAPEMVAFARVAARQVPGRPLFLTPDVEVARRAGATPDWAEVHSVRPEEVPDWLRRARAVWFFIRPTPAKRASCPTKLGEALATGLPVAANPGIGDVDQLLGNGVGVLVPEFAEHSYEAAARQLAQLLEDPATAGRCRRLAEERFDVRAAVFAYHDLYRELIKET